MQTFLDDEELSKAVKEAKRITLIANILGKRKYTYSLTESDPSVWNILELLLILSRNNGKASLTELTRKTGGEIHQLLLTLKNMEDAGLVKLFESTSRTVIMLTEKGSNLTQNLIESLST